MIDWSASRATPVGIARAEDPGRSKAKEAAEAVPTESVRSKRKSKAYLDFVLKEPGFFLSGLTRLFLLKIVHKNCPFHLWKGQF